MALAQSSESHELVQGLAVDEPAQYRDSALFYDFRLLNEYVILRNAP
jgi:hypothetical protein